VSFFGSLFGGQNGTLSSDMSKTGQISDFASGMGQSNATAGSGFFNSILSGDATKTAQALAPQTSALKTSVQNDQKTATQNGTRSGGTAATNAASKDKVHSDITNLTGSLTGGAASNLLSSGQSLLGTALGGYNQQAAMSQQQMQNWQNSILGKGITGAVQGAEAFGMGSAGGALPGGPGAAAGGQGAFASFLNG
jgi:hypothetical protein